MIQLTPLLLNWFLTSMAEKMGPLAFRVEHLPRNNACGCADCQQFPDGRTSGFSATQRRSRRSHRWMPSHSWVGWHGLIGWNLQGAPDVNCLRKCAGNPIFALQKKHVKSCNPDLAWWRCVPHLQEKGSNIQSHLCQAWPSGASMITYKPSCKKTESKPCFLNLDQNKIKKGPKSCGPVMSSQDYLKAPKILCFPWRCRGNTIGEMPPTQVLSARLES